VVGYGGSAILGYVLSLSIFPARIRERQASVGQSLGAGEASGGPIRKRSGLALSR
jgi:hypothetical protein